MNHEGSKTQRRKNNYELKKHNHKREANVAEVVRLQRTLNAEKPNSDESGYPFSWLPGANQSWKCVNI